MRKNHLLLLLAVMFSMNSCNYYEGQVAVNTTDANQEAIVDGKITLSRAISNADFIFRNTEGLGAKKRRVKSVDILSTSNTNSHIGNTRSSLNEQEEPVAYVVNYEDNDGFAILAADTKLPPVISIGDEGNFNTQGFIDFVQNHATRSNGEINPAQEVQYAIINNSLLLPPVSQPSVDIGPLNCVDTTVVLKCLPLVRTKWGQGAPYNYYAFDTENNEALAGCVPVAEAQVLAALCFHHNWRPTTQLSEDYYINWYRINRIIFDSISKFTYNDTSADALYVAALIRAVGEAANAQYGNDMTNVYTSDMPKPYQKLGMTNIKLGNEGTSTPVTRNDVFNTIISKNYPVTARADNSVTGKNGHCFILDGWLRLEYSIITAELINIDIENSYIKTDYTQRSFDLAHINLGWNGICDGYYLPDAFDLTNDKYREYAEAGDIGGYSSYVYDLNVKYLIYDL